LDYRKARKKNMKEILLCEEFDTDRKQYNNENSENNNKKIRIAQTITKNN
jgi:hypothetical protein